MNKILFLILALILIACTPQVTVTSEVTVTLPPPATIIPTPTLHPEFIAIQNLINDSGERFTLLPDGTIEELTADGGQKTIPNLHVDSNGGIYIIVNNENIAIEKSQIIFDSENGVVIEGYELNEQTGEWVEAVSEAMQMATELAEQYNLVDTERYTITESEDGSTASVIDNETGKVLIKSNGISTWYGIEFAAYTIAAASCESTPFKPNQSGFMLAEYSPAYGEYNVELLGEFNYNFTGLKTFPVLVDSEIQCWAVTDWKYIFYRDNKGVAHKLPLISTTEAERDEFKESRANK